MHARIVRALRRTRDKRHHDMSMTHRLCIANAFELRPESRGSRAFASAYRPNRGDRKALLATTC